MHQSSSISPCFNPPFGSAINEMQYKSDTGGVYRYGFNNQEKDNELGEYYAFEYRIQDARLCRFLSIDPLSYKFPFYSPYQYASNNPASARDLEGLETELNLNMSEQPNHWGSTSTSKASNNGYQINSVEGTCSIAGESNLLNSSIFTNVTFDEFYSTIRLNTTENGNNLNQSHKTDLCGKYNAVRLWVQSDAEAYSKVMFELYYFGQATLPNSQVITVSESIKSTLNSEGKLDGSPNQTWGTHMTLPSRTDLLLMLTLADNFHWGGGVAGDYSFGKHKENNGPWAGSTIGSEARLLNALGLENRKVDNNAIGISGANGNDLILSFSKGKSVLLLVNSYALNKIASNQIERPQLEGLEKIIGISIGTHWISILNIDWETRMLFYWEYGGVNSLKMSDEFFKTVAGGIIVK